MPSARSYSSTDLRAPFPWFGGKRKIAAEIWRRFGSVTNYVEPFFGSGAVLLGRPTLEGTETVNDIDGFVCNFWRSIRYEPLATARFADYPQIETDLAARHAWLISQRERMLSGLQASPDWCDPKIAGWWAWGLSSWIGSGFGSKPSAKIPSLQDTGRGVHRLSITDLEAYFRGLSDRLRRVRVTCGDWKRVCAPGITYRFNNRKNTVGLFLDPPYHARSEGLYNGDCIASDVCDFAIEIGSRGDMRIALCGYVGDYQMPHGWTVWQWKGQQGYAPTRTRPECVWFSPACLDPS